jgi:hypothetical protein
MTDVKANPDAFTMRSLADIDKEEKKLLDKDDWKTSSLKDDPRFRGMGAFDFNIEHRSALDAILQQYLRLWSDGDGEPFYDRAQELFGPDQQRQYNHPMTCTWAVQLQRVLDAVGSLCLSALL